MRRAAASAALLMAIAAAARAAPTGSGREAVSGRYVNREYGFEVTVPAHVRASRPAAPAPNHGVELTLGAHRSLSIFAAFNAAGYASTEDLLAARLPDKGRVVRRAAALGGEPALRAEVARGDAVEIVVARQTGPDVDDVTVTVDLNTTSASRAQDVRVLDRVLASYRQIPREH